jgi:3-hydroxyacyl-CoA dehydrogenase/enoyl-CoA hydratase/3-hydroxybutyryl-CoA epimerase
VSSCFSLRIEADGIGLLTLDVPEHKLNVLTRQVLEELGGLMEELAARSDIGCLVLLSGKEEGFIAGADIEMIAGFTDPAEAFAATRAGQEVFDAWERLPFPTVAAIRGTCLGGGTELALASTYRVAVDRPEDRIGLPEIQIGIVPGLGGCTRLPRCIGLPEALDIILAGKSVPPRKALKLGLVDALLPEPDFLRQARSFALAQRGKPRPKAAFQVKRALLGGNRLGRKLVLDQARKQVLARTGGHYPAPLKALEVIRIGLEEGVAAGLVAEARANSELIVSPVCKNLLHVFRLTQEAKKQQGLPGGPPRPVTAAAVLGAGVMGGGIAQLLAEKLAVPVRMKDIQEAALASGMEHAGSLFRKRVERRRLSEAEAKRRLALIRPTLDDTGFGRVDVVIEAVVEKLPVKQEVFAQVERQVPEQAVLASNTSSLSIATIGERTAHPERVVGMHFFNPVDKMPLVEVIATERSEPWAVNTIFKLCRDLGKTPVLVRDRPGFLVNRLLTFYSVEALWLLEEGYKIEDLDQALVQWGMPVGPLALNDEVGTDVAIKVAHILHEAFGDRLPLPSWVDRSVEDGRLGKKSGRGFYRYQGRERKGPDPEVYRLLGLGPRLEEADPRRVVDRSVLRMVDEAARCLDEGLVESASSVDLSMIFGTGFPPFRGGVCRWADREGLPAIIAALERFAREVGPRYEPGAALQSAAAAGGFYARWPARGEG